MAQRSLQGRAAQIRSSLAHEEIAPMIGASRETVTRLFADFKKNQLLQVKGSTLIITNKAELESVVSS
jgi:CRP-like cAMP-binding protein